MIHARVSPRTLGLARILVFGAWIVTVWRLVVPDLARLPADALVRPGLLQLVPEAWFSACLAPHILAGFRFALLGLLAWLVLGLRPYRSVALVACAALVLYDGLTKSLGYINHGETGLLYAAFVLAIFPCDEAMTLARGVGVRSSPEQRSAAMLAVAVLLTATYSFTSIYRLDSAGPGLFTSDSIGAYVLRRGLEHNAVGFTWGLELLRHPLLFALLKAAFGVVSLMELTAPLLLFFRAYRRLWLGVMLGFHLLSWLLMNILFWQNALLVLFFLTDCDRLLARRASQAPTPADSPRTLRGQTRAFRS